LPHPFMAQDRAAGFRYELSIIQAEFARTQMLDRPVAGRIFFEEVIRENLDLGRPDNVQLIFERRVTKRTPGRFRTRVVTEGVLPSLYVDYKSSRIKQYFKEGQALRTETTINDTYDFGSILRTIEGIYGITEGTMGVADARSSTDLVNFFQGSLRQYVPVVAVEPASFFLGQAQKGAMEPPDNDGDDD